jgi:hypothetical protein
MPPEVEKRLRSIVEEAIRKFDLDGDLTLTVEDLPGEDERAYAGALGELIWFRPAFVESAAPDHLKAVVFEEVAHVGLGRLGVPHDITPGRLVQEAFAHWFWRSRLRSGWDPLDGQAIPIAQIEENWDLAWVAGFYIGAAQTGDRQARRMLEGWMQFEPPHAIADPERRFVSNTTRELLRMPFAAHKPRRLAEALAVFYDRRVRPQLTETDA